MAPPSLLDVPRLNGWAAQWDQLVDSSPLPSPFLRSWWLTGVGGAGRHFLLAVDGAHLLGGLALEERHPMLSVRMMGDGRCARIISTCWPPRPRGGGDQPPPGLALSSG